MDSKSHRFRRYELSERVKDLLKGFKIAESQGFDNYLEGERFLLEYCSYCQKGEGKKCKINYALRCAMGENDFFWANSFIKFERDSSSDWKLEAPERPPTIRVHCREYKEAQRKV